MRITFSLFTKMFLLSRSFSTRIRNFNFFYRTQIKNIHVSLMKYQNVKNLQDIVSFDDIRLQKHLKFIHNLSSKNNSPEKEGFSFQVLNYIRNLLEELENLNLEHKELELLISDIKEHKDELYEAAISERKQLECRLKNIQNEVLYLIVPTNAVDEKDIILEISPGVGGQEAMLFAKDMFEMYCSFVSWKGWNYEILKYETTDIGGIRSAHLEINGSSAFRTLRHECGVHRVQRVPKTEKAGRIHTSTTTVAVLPQPSEIEIAVHPNDIELEFKRSKGAGGQSVNTTDSCVRIYHKASGLVVECQQERDQHRNRAIAMKSLRARLYEKELETVQKETTSARKLQIGSAARSEKVRTYNFVQDRITDHRAQITIHDIQSFLKGEEHFDNLTHMLHNWSNVQSLIDTLNKYDCT